MEDESMKFDETDNKSIATDDVRTTSVHVISKTKGQKKLPKRSIKRKRFKWKFKKEILKSDPASVGSWSFKRKVAPWKKVNKRSRVESKLKYP
ncbi:hypothetical protein A2U01_0072470, partial [Trifolium medium]|nr:hypothetical protein [Trifolium medium]